MWIWGVERLPLTRQGDVHGGPLALAPASLVDVAGARPHAGLMHVNDQHAGVLVEDVHRAIAAMHVKVEDQDLRAARRLRLCPVSTARLAAEHGGMSLAAGALWQFITGCTCLLEGEHALHAAPW